jgi:hypothetical protein
MPPAVPPAVPPPVPPAAAMIRTRAASDCAFVSSRKRREIFDQARFPFIICFEIDCGVACCGEKKYSNCLLRRRGAHSKFSTAAAFVSKLELELD